MSCPYGTKRTVCIDRFHGHTLAVFDDLLTQTKQGAEFYIGQQGYIVVDIDTDEEDGSMLIVLQKQEPKETGDKKP